AGTGGYGFIVTMQDMVSRVKAGKVFMTLGEGEEPLAPVALAPGLTFVAALTAKGRLLVFPIEEMREVPRGRGVIIVGLDAGEKLIAVGLVPPGKVVVRGANRVGRVHTVVIEGDDLARHLLHRARKGSSVAQRIKPMALGE